ncbi:MAG: helix-turn-helix domain-containing protein [Ruminococcaceae bacterium]|nr:helix-turn-helix domain-containing protein [Oscillospiraceae bacterium]
MNQTNYEKQGYLLEDFRLFHLKGPGGIRTDYHYHEFCKLLLLLSGTGSYWIEGRQYALLPGDAVLVGSGCVHRPDFDPAAPYERIIIYISPEFLRRCSTDDCDLTACFADREHPVLRTGQGGRPLWLLAMDLEKQLSDEEYGRVILSRGALLRLLVEIGRALRGADVLQPAPAQPQDPRISAILTYIQAHLTEDLSIDMLAEKFYLSKYHMMRLFRACTGTSINTYITQHRLALARDLIAGGMSATESCFRAGFGSYSSFTRTYGKFYGTTPTGRNSPAVYRDDTYE